MPRKQAINGQPAVYNSSAPTLSDGDSSALNVDVNGNLLVGLSASGLGAVEITDGTNIVNVLKSDGTAAGQNAQLTAGTYLSVPFTTTTVQAVGTTDVGNYKWVSVQITSQGGSSTVSYQGSNDNTNWVAVTLLSSNDSGAQSGANSTTSSGLIIAGPLNYRYFRLNVTGIASGTTAGTILFSALPTSRFSSATSVSSANATGSAVPANAFYIAGAANSGNLNGARMGDIVDGSSAALFIGNQNRLYNGSTSDIARSIINANNSTGTGIIAAGLVAQLDDTSPTAITENQFGNVRMTADRSLMVNQVFSYNHIATSTTTTVKASAGFLHAISVNTLGTVASTTTIYDNTAGSGTVIGVINTLTLSGLFVLDVSFLTGLTIVTTGTAAPDITVSYR